METFLEKAVWRLKMAAQSRALRHVGLVHTTTTGLTLRVTSPADWTIYNNIFVDREYDRPIQDVLSRRGAKLHVLDLGANVGFFSLRFAHLSSEGPEQNDFSVTLVEGSPRTVNELRRRMDEQPKLVGRYSVLHGLAGKREGSAVLHETAYHGMNSLTARRLSKRFDVSFIDLSRAMERVESIDLLKCDIEGAEQLVLENYPDLLRKTRAAVFEFHHSQIDYAKCKEILEQCGLRRLAVLTERPSVTTEYFARGS